MCRAYPVLLFPGLSSRADAQRTLAPPCRTQGSFLDVTPMDRMHCGHQGLMGSSRAGTPMTDTPAGAVPVCQLTPAFGATVRSLLILVSPENRARNARRPPRIHSSSASGLKRAIPTLTFHGGGFTGMADRLSPSVMLVLAGRTAPGPHTGGEGPQGRGQLCGAFL